MEVIIARRGYLHALVGYSNTSIFFGVGTPKF